MFKRISVLLVAMLIFTTNSFAASQSGLKEAFNEFNYSVSVEWDQKDKAFYDQQVKKLQAEMQVQQANGVTNADLVQFVISESKNESLKKDLSLVLLQMKINQMSQAEALAIVKDKLNKTYAEGASWSGRGDQIIIGLVVVLVAVWAVAYVQCVSDPNHITVCSDVYRCHTEYDSYGSYDDCGYETSCSCSH
jgi:hypothetical protein